MQLQVLLFDLMVVFLGGGGFKDGQILCAQQVVIIKRALHSVTRMIVVAQHR